MASAMDAATLRMFEAVARLGGMNRAAQELHTVQSNVTARIRILEDELERPLFRRSSRGVTLTPAGQRLLPYARRVAHLLDEARQAVSDTGSPAGALTIGSLETTAAVRLPHALSGYAEAFPAVDLVISPGTTAELTERVLARQLEGAFVCGPVTHPDLSGETMFREQLALITHPSVKSLEALKQQSGLKIVVLRIGCSYRQRLEDFLAKRGIVGLRRLEFGTLDAIIGCVAAGVGITLLPEAVVSQAVQQRLVVAHAIPAKEAAVQTLFIRRRDAFTSSALEALLKEVRTRNA
jgi:DNA-binding transcriptional LysR family regulator